MGSLLLIGRRVTNDARAAGHRGTIGAGAPPILSHHPFPCRNGRFGRAITGGAGLLLWNDRGSPENVPAG